MATKHPNQLAREHGTLCLVRPGASAHWEQATIIRIVHGLLGDYDTCEPITRLVVPDRDIPVAEDLPIIDVGTVSHL